MKYINIKGLDKPVSEIILGTSWVVPENKEVVDQVFSDYIEAGGNMIDTGRFYSGGKAETYLKRWIKENPELRKKVMFTSKSCHYFIDENNVHYPEVSRVTPECITEDLEFSLNNLGLEKFEVFMLHRDNTEVPVGPLMDRLEKHRLEGKIGTYGLSNWCISRINEAKDYCEEKGYQGVCVTSPSYSLATVKTPRWFGTVYASDKYPEWNTRKDITVLSWGSQGGGFFGNYPFGGADPTEDFKTAYFNEENYEKLRRCKELAALKGESVEAINIALAYVLNQGLKIAAIIGPRNADELKSSLYAEKNITLTEQEVEYLSLRSDKSY